MLLYVLPIVVFAVLSSILYFSLKESQRKGTKNILLKNILPSFTMALVVFMILKYKDSRMFVQEPMLGGNYFD